MGAEQKPNSLGRSTAQNLRLLLEQSKNLIGEVTKTIDEDASEQIPAITAALQFTEDTSRLVRNMVETHGGVIFSRDEIKNPTKTDLSPTEPKKDETEPQTDKPKTFSDLLRKKIETAFPKDQTRIGMGDLLVNFSLSQLGLKNALKAENLQLQDGSLSRTEAIDVVYRIFITPDGHLKPKESYLRGQLLLPRFPIRAGELNAWSKEIGHDWKKNPTVDYNTAMQIRGLGFLNNTLAQNKGLDTLQPE